MNYENHVQDVLRKDGIIAQKVAPIIAQPQGLCFNKMATKITEVCERNELPCGLLNKPLSAASFD